MSFKKFIYSLCLTVILLISSPILILVAIPIQPKLLVAFNNAVIHDLLSIHWEFTNYVVMLVFCFLFSLIKLLELLHYFGAKKLNKDLEKKYDVVAFIASIIIGMLCTQNRNQFELSAGLISFILIFVRFIPETFKNVFVRVCTQIFYYWITDEDENKK